MSSVVPYLIRAYCDWIEDSSFTPHILVNSEKTGISIPEGFANDGKIILNNQEITNLPPFERDTGMVFQNYALFPHMTVNQNISFGLRMRNKGREEILIKTQNVLKLINTT